MTGAQPAPSHAGDSGANPIGQAIYEQGISASNVPACTACHGAKGDAIIEFKPNQPQVQQP